jgi:hypothetical protein
LYKVKNFIIDSPLKIYSNVFNSFPRRNLIFKRRTNISVDDKIDKTNSDSQDEKTENSGKNESDSKNAEGNTQNKEDEEKNKEMEEIFDKPILSQMEVFISSFKLVLQQKCLL